MNGEFYILLRTFTHLHLWFRSSLRRFLVTLLGIGLALAGPLAALLCSSSQSWRLRRRHGDSVVADWMQQLLALATGTNCR